MGLSQRGQLSFSAHASRLTRAFFFASSEFGVLLYQVGGIAHQVDRSHDARLKDYTRKQFKNGLILSVCRYCFHMLAARCERTLQAAEKAHSCPEKEAAKAK
jgi:hypothetical protein